MGIRLRWHLPRQRDAAIVFTLSSIMLSSSLEQVFGLIVLATLEHTGVEIDLSNWPSTFKNAVSPCRQLNVTKKKSFGCGTVFGVMLGRPWPLVWCLGVHLGCPGEVLGSTWGAQGRPWEPFGRLWGSFWPLWRSF